jgi:8-oxo-dGTP pyrophosphatase MutT (NUDIX family)
MKYIKAAFLAFFDTDGKILLNHRKDGLSLHEDVWEIMGGGIEEHEQPLDTIKREMGEELNYKVSEAKDGLSFVKKFEIKKPSFVAEVYFFKANFLGFDNFSDSNEVKLSDLKLFSVEEALRLPLLPICREILLTLD